MELPDNKQELLKDIIRAGFLTTQSWKARLKVPESLKGDISSLIKCWVDDEHHPRFNGVALLGFCRIHQKNVQLVLKLGDEMKDVLKRMVLFSEISLLDFVIPELEDVDMEACLKNGMKFRAEKGKITMQEDPPSNGWEIVTDQEDLEYNEGFLSEIQTYISSFNDGNDIEGALVVDTSGSQPESSTSSPAAFPDQSGLFISPVESNQGSVEPSEPSIAGDPASYSPPHSVHYGVMDFDEEASSQHVVVFTRQETEDTVEDREETRGQEDRANLDFHFDISPPRSPAIGPPMATSTPIKKNNERRCQMSEETRTEFNQTNGTSKYNTSKKNTSRPKRVKSLIKKTTPAKRARLPSNSGIVYDESGYIGQNDDYNDAVDFNRMSPIDYDVDDAPDYWIDWNRHDNQVTYNRADNQVDEMNDDDLPPRPRKRNHPIPQDNLSNDSAIVESDVVETSPNGTELKATPDHKPAERTIEQVLAEENSDFERRLNLSKKKILTSLPGLDMKTTFTSLLEATGTNRTAKDAAFSFYSLLAMTKKRIIDVVQAEPFGEIEVTQISLPEEE